MNQTMFRRDKTISKDKDKDWGSTTYGLDKKSRIE
jgi:hypothetical protein